jgi:hypothetical protein
MQKIHAVRSLTAEHFVVVSVTGISKQLFVCFTLLQKYFKNKNSQRTVII